MQTTIAYQTVIGSGRERKPVVMKRRPSQRIMSESRRLQDGWRRRWPIHRGRYTHKPRRQPDQGDPPCGQSGSHAGLSPYHTERTASVGGFNTDNIASRGGRTHRSFSSPRKCGSDHWRRRERGLWHQSIPRGEGEVLEPKLQVCLF